MNSLNKKARKVGGSFEHTGTIVAEFTTTRGDKRVVLEFDNPVSGMLHIYRPDQLNLIVPKEKSLFSKLKDEAMTLYRLARPNENLKDFRIDDFIDEIYEEYMNKALELRCQNKKEYLHNQLLDR